MSTLSGAVQAVSCGHVVHVAKNVLLHIDVENRLKSLSHLLIVLALIYCVVIVLSSLYSDKSGPIRSLQERLYLVHILHEAVLNTLSHYS